MICRRLKSGEMGTAPNLACRIFDAAIAKEMLLKEALSRAGKPVFIEERNWGEIARTDGMKIALRLRLGKVRGLREDVAIHGLEV